MVRENQFQAELIKDLKFLMPDCVVLKNDANYMQGFPDLLILRGPRWAALEVKASENAARQPNQEWHIDNLNYIGGYASFIHPGNREEVIDAVQSALRPRG